MLSEKSKKIDKKNCVESTLPKTGLLFFPPAIQSDIVSKLDPKSLFSLSKTDKYHRDAINNDNDLWFKHINKFRLNILSSGKLTKRSVMIPDYSVNMKSYYASLLYKQKKLNELYKTKEVANLKLSALDNDETQTYHSYDMPFPMISYQRVSTDFFITFFNYLSQKRQNKKINEIDKKIDEIVNTTIRPK